MFLEELRWLILLQVPPILRPVDCFELLDHLLGPLVLEPYLDLDFLSFPNHHLFELIL